MKGTDTTTLKWPVTSEEEPPSRRLRAKAGGDNCRCHRKIYSNSFPRIGELSAVVGKCLSGSTFRHIGKIKWKGIYGMWIMWNVDEVNQYRKPRQQLFGISWFNVRLGGGCIGGWMKVSDSLFSPHKGALLYPDKREKMETTSRREFVQKSGERQEQKQMPVSLKLEG